MIVPSLLMERSGPGGQDVDEAIASVFATDQEFCADTADDFERILTRMEEIPRPEEN
ncbi:hypothetical protein AB6O49_16430 [Streptomyces sp. SBR177]